MSDVVIDSSVAAKWVLDEPDSDQADRLMLDAATAGHRLIVLDLALVEIANAIWKRYHRKLCTASEASAQLESLFQIPLHIEPALPRLPRGSAIAQNYGRSVYDALFVALAEELNLPGVTADEPLQKAVCSDFPTIRLLKDWTQFVP
jgi:predicted nucleic acid-binding protein